MRTILTLLVLTLPALATAKAPSFLPVQGYLTSEGKAVDGDVDVRFTLYTAPQGGIQLWQETQQVSAEKGVFHLLLGMAEPLDLGMFADYDGLWLGIKVANDSEMQRVFMGSVPYAGYAEHCGTIPSHQHDVLDVKNAAQAGQLCPAGSIATGIDANGKLICSEPGTQSGGYALSGQWCPANHLMSGIDANGYPICVPANQGGNFALASQSCSSNKVVVGVDSAGNLVCDDLAGAGGLSGSGYAKRLALWKSSDELEDSVVTESSGKIGINNTSPSQTLDVKGNLKVSGEIHWGGNKFTSSSCLVVGGSSCSSACSAHGMSCSKAFRIDGDSTSTSCSQSGFKFCCCTD
jgi:hypothetical protein